MRSVGSAILLPLAFKSQRFQLLRQHVEKILLELPFDHILLVQWHVFLRLVLLDLLLHNFGLFIEALCCFD